MTIETMGNSPMQIGLKVESGMNGGIIAGSIIRGKIYLHNNKETAAHPAHSIRLKLVGTEEAVVHHVVSDETSSRHNHRHGAHHRNSDHNQSSSRDEYEHHTDVFYKVDHTIKTFHNGVIPKGQFEFPFALQLPKSLPSSMEAKSGESHCSVRYELFAEVSRNTLFYSNEHAVERLTVIAMPSTVAPDRDSSLHLPVEIAPISTCNCCCFASCTKVGTMALEGRFDKTTLFLNKPSLPKSFWNHNRRPNNTYRSNDNGPSQSIGVQFRCENKSTQVVKSVEASLCQSIEWRVNGQSATAKTTLASSSTDASQYPELGKMFYKPFSWQLHQYQPNEVTTPLLDAKPWRTIDPRLFVEGADAVDTYRGTAVNVRHVLSLEVRTQACCSTNPESSALVEIYRNPAVFGAEGVGEMFTAAASNPMAYAPTASSAPSDTAPSAPSSFYDDSSDTAYQNISSAPVEPMVEAKVVLPKDWNAHIHDIVNIPIAEATVVS